MNAVVRDRVRLLRAQQRADRAVHADQLASLHISDIHGAVPDDRRPRWPNFKQTEEFHNITIFFLILQNLLLK